MTEIERRIEKHRKASERARARGDTVAYCRERKAMLAAQYELWQMRRPMLEAK